MSKELSSPQWDSIKKITSSDENVAKYIFTKADAVAEAVLYKYPTYNERTVICCSTMSGCPVGCRFCGAGDAFVRALTHQEISSQVVALFGSEIDCKPEDIKKLQIMYMSMGEPMLNYMPLMESIGFMTAYLPSHAQLLISTSAPKGTESHFEHLAIISAKVKQIGLQFSVHESTDEARKKLIPTATMTLAEIAKTGEAWCESAHRKPYFNYCVHEGNNTDEDVDRLEKLFNPEIWNTTLSVICERDENVAASNLRQLTLVQDFSEKLLKQGFSVRIFNPGGQDDIGGGCGQLWHTQDWMRKHPELAKVTKGASLPIVHTPK